MSDFPDAIISCTMTKKEKIRCAIIVSLSILILVVIGIVGYVCNNRKDYRLQNSAFCISDKYIPFIFSDIGKKDEKYCNDIQSPIILRAWIMYYNADTVYNNSNIDNPRHLKYEDVQKFLKETKGTRKTYGTNTEIKNYVE